MILTNYKLTHKSKLTNRITKVNLASIKNVFNALFSNVEARISQFSLWSQESYTRGGRKREREWVGKFPMGV